MKGGWRRWGAAVLVAVVMLLTGCGRGNNGQRVTADNADTPTPQTVEGLMLCDDIPKLSSRVEGTLGPGLNADDDVMDVVLAYREENPESHGGLWIDRDNGGAIVLAVTDDPEEHRQELHDRLSGLDAVIDVVQVEFSKAELLKIQGRLGQYMGPEFGLLSTSASDSLNRVSLDFYDPPEGTFELFAEFVDPAAVCVNVIYSPEPPSGPLALIPDLEEEDPLVTCHSSPPVPYSSLSNPLPTNQGTGRSCEPVVVLPDGLNRVAIRLDPHALPSPEDRTIHVLATETECASGREMGDALLGPQLIETDEAVLLAFAAVSSVGPAECPGNPSTSVTIELSQPLGQRILYDGLYVPPKPLSVDEGW